MKGKCVYVDPCSRITCYYGGRCVNGNCVNVRPFPPITPPIPQCYTSASCTTGQKCQNNQCITINIGTYCNFNTDCGNVQQCISYRCTYYIPPTPAPVPIPQPVPVPTCYSSNDCGTW